MSCPYETKEIFDRGYKAGLEKARELAEKARMDYVMSLKDDEQNFTLKEGSNIALNKITAMIDEELKGAK